MLGWRRVSLVGPGGALSAPGRIADEVRDQGDRGGIVLGGHLFGRVTTHAVLLCHHLRQLGRPWAAEAELSVAGQPALLRLARRSGCHALLLGPEPDPLLRTPEGGEGFERLRAAAADLRRIRRAGLLTVVTCRLGQEEDDAGVFGRAVWLCTAGRVAFPRLLAGEGTMSPDELARGLAWARHALHTHRAIWRRAGVRGPGRAALLANYRTRRAILAEPPLAPTPAMRVARALARPIRVRERVAFVSTLVDAVHARSGQVRSAWLRARAMRDETVAALVIRLEGAVDARAARKLVARVRRALGHAPDRIVVDVSGVERVSLSVLTRFLEEHAARLGELRGRLAFRNLRPALAALRRNLHGMLPNAALLEGSLEEAG